MRHPTLHQLRPKRSAKPTGLSAAERQFLLLLSQGASLRRIGRHLQLTDAGVNACRRGLMRKFKALTTEDLVLQAAAAVDLRPTDRTPPLALTLHHQSRWLPEVKLGIAQPLSVACRQVFMARTLRDVADALRDCGNQPGPAPDDPVALLTHLTGTLGAKQALIAALAAECGREEVQLVLACHELPPDTPEEPEHPSLPLVVCCLQIRARAIQIAEPGSGSHVHRKALSRIRVRPETMSAERVNLYRMLSADWCRALDFEPAAFARLRAKRLRDAIARSVYEDLLGYGLPPSYQPSTG